MFDIYNDDCIEFMSRMADNSVDMILSDPPYGVSYQSNRRTTTNMFDLIANDDGLSWLDDFARECHRIVRNDSSVYVFCSWHKIETFKTVFEQYFKLKNLIVWVKNNHGSGDLTGAYAPKHELILYLHKGRSLLRNGRMPDVIHADKVAGSKLVHPAEKPVKLLETFIINSTDSNQTVFDPFMGSGTTGVACQNTGRNFIGVEINPTYYLLAMSRLVGNG